MTRRIRRASILPGSAAGPDRASGEGAIVLVAFALLAAAAWGGAFALGRWVSLELFMLAILIGALAARRRGGHLPGAVRFGLGGLWGLAAWSGLSMTWAESSADALVGGERAILYATVVSLPFVLRVSARALRIAAWSVVAGIAGIGLEVLVRLLADGSPLFLAGRLDDPIGYRNATALLFALPVWPMIVAASSRSFRPVARAVALALATLCLGLAFLTQSRGVLLGLVVGAIVVFTAGPERVRRAWMTILAVAPVALASGWLLRPFHAFAGGAGAASGHDIRVAGAALTLATAVALGAGLAIVRWDAGLPAGSPGRSQIRRAARFLLAGGLVAAVIACAAAVGDPASFVHRKWELFHDLNGATVSSGTRLLTVGGQRYDLWRVALREFDGAPLLGVGSENYAFGYYRLRRTDRNVEDPHSLLFALLSETGAVGVALFGLFLAGFAAAFRRGWTSLLRAERLHAIAPAALGAVLLGQSAVDWMWLIPGLTSLGLLSLAIAVRLCRPPALPGAASRETVAPSRRVPARLAARATALGGPAVAVGLLVAVAAALALLVSNAYVERARRVAGDPPAELAAARVAAALDPWSVAPHYLEASALETEGRRAAAHAQLTDALGLEPANSATLGVLGDFEVRGGNVLAARAFYRRALALNPLDTGLQELARIGTGSVRAGTRAPR